MQPTVGADIICPLYTTLWELGFKELEPKGKYPSGSIAGAKKLPCISDPRVLCLPPTSVKLGQAAL